MKKLLYLAIPAILLASSCEKSPKDGTKENARRYFEAWVHVNCPDAERTALGSCIIEDEPGDGPLVGIYSDHEFVRMRYTVSELDGTVNMTTEESVAKRVGTYSVSSYYGPQISSRTGDGLYAGVEDMLSTMRVGGRRKVAIPGWLMTRSRYATADEYAAKVDGTSAIYDVTVTEVIDDIVKWETDSLARYVSSRHGLAPSDSASANGNKFGFYYVQKKAPDNLSEEAFKKDTVIYINYIGRLANGTVFDTNIEDVAKENGLYRKGNSYKPAIINWKVENYSEITMTSKESKMIDGFSFALHRMRSHEKGVAIFYSGLGYGSDGTGTVIPPYSPLEFEIELVDGE